jgi:erythromycin esterase-like protein
MLAGNASSWNVRDTHMADTLDRLLGRYGSGAKAVVWEHNTHVGDARATDMARAGMVNVGQLVRERHERDGVFIVGFSGHRGEVVAADRWGGPMRRFEVPVSPAGSHELLLHLALGAPSILLFPDDRSTPWLSATRGHRAIGVVYDPRRDRYGNWVLTVMGGRYDALCSFDETTALHPLHLEVAQPSGEQETSPWGT